MKSRDLIVGMIVLFVFIFIVIAISVLKSKSNSEDSIVAKTHQVGVVEIEGPIRDSKTVIEWIEKLRKDKNIKSVVVRINSPGGAVAPSQEIYSALLRLKKSGKPVVASMSSVAASGGYYIAVAADTIVANPGTITGSIGVILTFPIYDKLADKVGVKVEVIKSGKLKDVGNPFRNLTPDERAYLQASLDDTYEQFTSAVAEQRELPIDSVLKLADGRIYTGQQAYRVGLVDVLGTFQDAVRIAAKMGGIVGEPKLFEKKKKTSLIKELLLGDDESNNTNLLQNLLENHLFETSPVFEYRWIIQ
ncbi:MAG: signal peptide peptidase SppA [bacterium]|nr:signal peptide peptidase SppA [bacterium]